MKKNHHEIKVIINKKTVTTIDRMLYNIGIMGFQIRDNFFEKQIVDAKDAYRLDEYIQEEFKDLYDNIFTQVLLMNIIYYFNMSLGLMGIENFTEGSTYFMPITDDRTKMVFKNYVINLILKQQKENIELTSFVEK